LTKINVSKKVIILIFNKFISIDEDIENININSKSNMNIKSETDTGIISNKSTPLTLSYFLNIKNIFKYILDHCDINEVDTLQYSIMYYAVLKKDIVTVKLLLEKGSNINFYQHYNGRGHSAFDITIAIGNHELFNLFIDSGKVLLDQPNQRKETIICIYYQLSIIRIKLRRNGQMG